MKREIIRTVILIVLLCIGIAFLMFYNAQLQLG